MASKEYFFEKMFLKSDEAKHLYSNYDFNQLTVEEKKFLSRLTVFSKYKQTLQKYLTRKNIGLMNKAVYIQLNAGHLNYDEFIDAERCLEYYNDTMKGAYTSFLMTSGLLWLGVIAWKSAGSSIFKDVSRFIGVSFIAHVLYFLNYREYTYKPVIEKIYESLSVRLNSVEDLKYGNFAEDSKGNYFRTDHI